MLPTEQGDLYLWPVQADLGGAARQHRTQSSLLSPDHYLWVLPVGWGSAAIQTAVFRTASVMGRGRTIPSFLSEIYRTLGWVLKLGWNLSSQGSPAMLALAASWGRAEVSVIILSYFPCFFSLPSVINKTKTNKQNKQTSVCLLPLKWSKNTPILHAVFLPVHISLFSSLQGWKLGLTLSPCV